MFYSENADYEIIKKSSLHHNIENSIQSQTVQIVMNLISDDNIFSMILKNMLFLLKQWAVVNSSFDESTLTFCSHTDDFDNDFLKKIRIKKLTDYYNKFLHEYSEWTHHLAQTFHMLFKYYIHKEIKILYINIFLKNEIEQIWTRKKLSIDFTTFTWNDFIFFLFNQIDDKQNRNFMIIIHFTDLA